MLNQAGKPNAAERRKSSRSGSRLDEIGQARRRLYWRALRCSKQLKRPPQTARRPAEEQAERGAARTPALFSSANARTTARLLRGSSFLPSFLSFVFNFPPYAASKQSREATPCDFQCNAFCLKRERRELRTCVSEHNFPFKRNMGVGHMRGSNQSRSTT